MCAPSLVHPRPVRQLRDLTRYRRTLIRERTREKQRLEKMLEDAQIKLSAVVSDIFGVSGRAMIEADDRRAARPQGTGAAGPRPHARQDQVLEEALTGHFDDHHAFICQMMLDRIDGLTARIAELDRQDRGADRPATLTQVRPAR